MTINRVGFAVLLSGRIDGVFEMPDGAIVEEIKSTVVEAKPDWREIETVGGLMVRDEKLNLRRLRDTGANDGQQKRCLE